ncbi:hypothetical protein ACLE20_08905 [Rhizobium sp. YIM 134829]|uniref:hypothetical protein n=1 Tax=Rhizobium sp. YIM 134829 TaxID=3390453 RepID=UPI0039783283
MARKPKKQRNAEQVVRQQRVRDQARARRRPTRDDLARVLLWQMINAALEQKDPHRALGKVRDSIVEDLERQGFDVRESEEFFHQLADRYHTSGYPFRIKRHILSESAG